MASPLVGIAGVNSLLFASYGISKRIISPFPQLSLPEISLAGNHLIYLRIPQKFSWYFFGGLSGAMAGAANAVLASPVEMFKVRMQAQYGSATDKRLRNVVKDMWSQWGFRKGVMRGYWVNADGWICLLSVDFLIFASRSHWFEKYQPMLGMYIFNWECLNLFTKDQWLNFLQILHG